MADTVEELKDRIRYLEAEVEAWRNVYNELMDLKISVTNPTEEMYADLVNLVSKLRWEARKRGDRDEKKGNELEWKVALFQMPHQRADAKRVRRLRLELPANLRCLYPSTRGLFERRSRLRIESIKLQKIANHAETEFDFPDVPILTFVGDSGSGKTSLIEAVPLAIYGMSPSREANVYQSASRSWRGKCLIEAVVAENGEGGRRLKIARTWTQDENVTGSEHRVFISEDREGEWVQISSGKIADAKKILDPLFPPYEVFLVTNFAAQTGGSLLSASQEERREILGTLLSPLLFAEFDSLHEASKKERQLEEDRNRKVKQQLSFVQDRFVEISGKQGIPIPDIRKDIARQELALSESNAKLAKISKEGSDLKVAFAEVQFQIETLSRLKKEQDTEQKRLDQVTKEIEAYVEETFDPNQLELLRAEKRKKAELQEQLQELQNKRIEAEQELRRIEARRIEKFGLFQTLRKAIATLDEVPCDEDLHAICPFVKDAAEAKRALPDLAKALDKIDEEMATAEELVRSREGVVSITLGKLERFVDLEDRERELLELKQSIELRKTTHDSLLREQKQLVNRITKLIGDSAEIQIDPKAREFPVLLDQLRKRWTEANEAHSILKGKMQNTRRSLTIAEQNAEEIRRITGQVKEVGKEILVSDAEMAIWSILEEGFSRRGAQALLLKHELDLFETIIQDYLDVVFANTGKDIKLTFVMEKPLKTKKDKFRESLSIRCEINGVALEAHELSGGEGQGVSIALRAGLLFYNQMKNGGGLSLAIFDEPTSKVDSRISLNVLGVFEKLGEAFPQVIVATYDEDLMRTSEICKVQEEDGVATIERL